MRLERDGLVLRTVNIKDAEFILSLRLNNNLNRYLSPVDNNLQNQIEWINRYKKREKDNKEYYFVIEDDKYTKFGTLRIYNIVNGECEWGSFILLPERPIGFSYKSALLSFDFLFRSVNVKKINLEVYRDNKRAIHIYSKLGFVKMKSDEDKIYMTLSKQTYTNKIGGI